MEAPPTIRVEVLEALGDIWTAYQNKDLRGALACFIPDADFYMLGSGGDELWIGRENARAGLARDFAQAEQIHVETANEQVSAAGDVAWLGADCSFMARVKDRKVEMKGRLTAVLVRREERWYLAQAHFSMPYGRQAAGESFPGGR